MKALPVVYNPTARGGRSHPPREALESAAERRGYRLEWWSTEAPGHAVELAAKAGRDRIPVLAAWGGDGTYNEVAQGLVGSDTHLLILPGGTTSVLAYELGIPRDPCGAFERGLDGAARSMAVGRTDRGQLFLLMLSAGPDSLILEKLPPGLKSRGGRAGITLQAVFEFLRASLPVMEVRVDGASRPASWCIVGNCTCYGGPYRATPGADPFSASLEAVVLTRFGRAAVVPFFFAIPSGRHLRQAGVERLSVAAVELTSEVPVPFQLDGDPAGHLPVAARASGEWLRILVPSRE